jgi:hypothetical protein
MRSLNDPSDADGCRSRRYFFLPEPNVGCHPAAFWLGAAAIVLIFSFLGFLDSRLPRCSPLAMSISLRLMMTQQLNAEFQIDPVPRDIGTSFQNCAPFATE